MPWKQSSLPAVREQLVQALLGARETVAEVCRRFGVSRQTAYKFKSRFLQEGRRGLVDRCRGPKCRGAGRWQRERRAVLCQWRRRSTWGARKLRWWLRQRYPHTRLPAERTVHRWLQTADLVPVRVRRRRVGAAVGGRPTSARRPNDVWTMDLKGWFCTGDGRKVEPLTVRDLMSRFLLSAQPLRRRSETAVRARCRRLFARYGCPRVIRTDLGSPFCGLGPHGLTALSLWWHRLGVRVEFVGRARRVDNNAHEQMHRVLKAETASPPAHHWQAQCRRLQRWCQHYNYRRPHDGLGLRVPAALYRPSRNRPAPLRLPRYPAGWLVRRVRRQGDVCVAGRWRQIGRAFAGLPVGCRPVGHRYEVYFGRLHLGTLTPQLTRHLQPTSRPQS